MSSHSIGARTDLQETTFPLRQINFEQRSREAFARAEKSCRKSYQSPACCRVGRTWIETPQGAGSAGPQLSFGGPLHRLFAEERRGAGGGSKTQVPQRVSTLLELLFFSSSLLFSTMVTCAHCIIPGAQPIWRESALYVSVLYSTFLK